MRERERDRDKQRDRDREREREHFGGLQLSMIQTVQFYEKRGLLFTTRLEAGLTTIVSFFFLHGDFHASLFLVPCWSHLLQLDGC